MPNTINTTQLLSARILIVDDEPANVKLLEKVLKQKGYTCVISTNDPNQVVSLYKSYHPDAILLDLNMPYKSGFDVMEELKQIETGYLPIVVLTAYSDQDIRILALRSGAKDYLVKPFDTIEVIHRLNNVLEVKLLLNLIQEQNEHLEQRVQERSATLAHEMAERKKVEQESLKAALRDSITQLPNYSGLLGQLEYQLSLVAKEDALALMVLAVDRFTEINRTLGHDNGDLVLQNIAKRIATCVRRFPVVETEFVKIRRGDTVARYAGGKFALVVCFIHNKTHLEQIIKRVLEVIQIPMECEGISLEITATLGIAIYPEHGSSSNKLIRHAEIALQHARDNQLESAIFTESMDTYSPQRLALMADLRRAVQNNSHVIHYQPIVDLKTKNIKGVEALLRWPQPNNVMLQPMMFVPLAEQSGLIKTMTHWVLEHAITDAAAFSKIYPDLGVSVNVSAYCLRNDDILRLIPRLLERHKFPAAMLTLEITESAMMGDLRESTKLLYQLHDLGVKLSIDDFGTGYSSLVYLKQLPVDEVKIDRMFIKDVTRSINDKKIVRTIIDMSHNFDLKVVAEGVENESTLDMLSQEQCDLVQGYYYAEPMAAASVGPWLANHKASA